MVKVYYDILKSVTYNENCLITEYLPIRCATISEANIGSVHCTDQIAVRQKTHQQEVF